MLLYELKNLKIIFIAVIFCLLINENVYANQYKFVKIKDLNNPWGMSFISNDELIISEQGGKLILVILILLKQVKVDYQMLYTKKNLYGLLIQKLEKNGKLMDFLER